MSYQLLMAKKEVTYGVAPAMTAAAAVFCENVQFKLLGERVVLDVAKPSSAANPGVIAAAHASIAFDVLLTGSGTPGEAPAWGQFMQASGYTEEIEEDESVSYVPMANPLTSTSEAFIFRDSGRLHRAMGWRGRVGFKAMKNQPLRLSFNGLALVADLEAGAALVPADADFSAWPTLDPISQARTTFSLGGVPMALLELSADTADNVKFHDIPGFGGVRFGGDRAMSGKVSAHMPAVGTYNPQSKWKNGTIDTFNLVDGNVAGKIATINGRMQLDAPDWTRTDEIDTLNASMFLVGSDLSSNNDFSIVLT